MTEELNQEVKNNNSKKTTAIVVGIVIAAIVAILIVLAIAFNWFGKKDGNQTQTTPAPVIVTEFSGTGNDYKDIKIKIRDIKLGSSIKEVKKFEDKQKDTAGNPTEANSADNYTYLNYQLTPDATVFGIKPTTKNSLAFVQHSFYKKKLFSTRYQLGKLSKKDEKKVLKALKKKYGKPTYSSKYSNNGYKYLWKTKSKKQKTGYALTMIYDPTSGVSVTYESEKR